MRSSVSTFQIAARCGVESTQYQVLLRSNVTITQEEMTIHLIRAWQGLLKTFYL